MLRDDIEKFILENINHGFFTGGISVEKINEIEKDLNVNLPESYKWFLHKYGFGGLFGVEILGCGKSGIPSVVTQTERYRNLGLPLHYVVISNSGEWVYCLDLRNRNTDDCKIISWDRTIGFKRIEADGFYEFLLRELEEGKEVWKEDF